MNRSGWALLLLGGFLSSATYAQEFSLAEDCSYGEIDGVSVLPHFPGPDNDLVFYDEQTSEILASWSIDEARIDLPECAHLLSGATPPAAPAAGQQQQTSQTASTAPAPTGNAMADEMVAAHNAWRSRYSLSALSWADDLAQFARNYASQLADSGCQMVHSQGNDFGENLYWASPLTRNYSDGRQESEVQQVRATQVVDSWGDEVKWYDYNSNSCSAPPGESCGHYTQVIWSDTREVGCAQAICPDKGQIWSCNYRPAGNYTGKRPY